MKIEIKLVSKNRAFELAYAPGRLDIRQRTSMHTFFVLGVDMSRQAIALSNFTYIVGWR